MVWFSARTEKMQNSQDWLGFFSSVIDSLAWPILLGIIIILFKEPLIELIKNIKSIKFKEFEAQFWDKLEKISNEVEIKPSSFAKKDPSISETKAEARFEKFLEVSPNGAIVETWMEIEEELRKIAKRKNYSLRRGSSGLFLTRVLTKDKTLPIPLAQNIDDLRNLRNEAAHSPHYQQVSVDIARNYREIAHLVKMQLGSIFEKI